METKTNYNTTKQYLMGVNVPVETRTYKPVTHKQLIDLTLESIDKEGFKLSSEKYTAAREGNVANARYTISNVADNEMQLQVGFQNSLDKSLSLKFSIGTQIMICSNGCVRGDYGAFKKKHQGDIQSFAPNTISEYIKKAADSFKLMQEEREKMKQIEIDETVTAHILGEMFLTEDFINSTQMNIIKREIFAPTYDYGAPGSLWNMFNHTTLSLKEIHPTLWMSSHIDAHKYFMGKAGILLENKKSVVAVDEYHISPNQLTLPLIAE